MSEAGRLRAATLLSLVATVVVASASPAVANTTFVTVDDSAPAVEEVDGGGYKLSVGLTNITDQPVAVTIDATSPKLRNGCTAKIGSGAAASVPKASHGDVVLEFDASCTKNDVNKVTLGAGPAAAQTILLTPKDPEKAKPDWDLLRAFPFATLGAFLFVCVLGFVWNVGPRKELANLPDTWKFSDSLVTNVTLVGGALAGVVGSSGVVKAFLGKDADMSIALATVGVAVAAVIIGVGAVVLQTARRNAHFTVGGLLAAAAIVLGGAYGELYVVWQNGEELDLGGWQDRLGWVAVILAVLLLAYSYVSLKETLEQGLATPKPVALELSADAIAATVIASKLRSGTDPDQLLKEIRKTLEDEAERQTKELKKTETQAAPAPRIQAIRLTPQATPLRKSALL